jgi:hypothetical protein
MSEARDVAAPAAAGCDAAKNNAPACSRAEYRAPQLVVVGNVNDLVAGSGGTKFDASLGNTKA